MKLHDYARVPCTRASFRYLIRVLALGSLLLVTSAVSSCASLPVDVAEANRITAAHATLVAKLGPISLLRTSSFAVLEAEDEPQFSASTAYVSHQHPLIEIIASDRLIQSGFTESHALSLLAIISRSQQHLEQYLMRPVPIRSYRIMLTSPDELVRMHATSLSISRQHRFTLSFHYSISDPYSSNRRVVRTLSHEIFHATVGLYGRESDASKEMEELAAYTLEDCIEIDTFGSTDFFGDASPTLSRPRTSAYPLTSDRQLLASRSLDKVCHSRIAQVAGWISRDASTK